MATFTENVALIKTTAESGSTAANIADIGAVAEKMLEIYVKILAILKEHHITGDEAYREAREVLNVICQHSNGFLSLFSQLRYDSAKIALELSNFEEVVKPKAEQEIKSLETQRIKENVSAQAVARSVDDNFIINLINDYIQYGSVLGTATDTTRLTTFTSNVTSLISKALPLTSGNYTRDFYNTFKAMLERDLNK